MALRCFISKGLVCLGRFSAPDSKILRFNVACEPSACFEVSTRLRSCFVSVSQRIFSFHYVAFGRNVIATLPSTVPEANKVINHFRRRKLPVMRIAYLYLECDLSREGGVLEKIVTQIRAWKSQNNEVKFFALSHLNGNGKGVSKVPEDVPAHIIFDKAVFGRVAFPWSVITGVSRRFSKVNELVQSILNWKPDLVYHRINSFYPALEFMHKQVPTALEVNTDDLAESRLTLPAHKYWFRRLIRGRVLETASGMVFVSSELARRYARYEKPALILGNFIDLSKHTPVAKIENPMPRLIFIASPELSWQGLDKVFFLAKVFPKWHFDVIGYAQTDIETQATSNVVLHGYLERKQYEGLIQKADVGVGTLSLHVKEMNEASPLKVREYLAYGLPIIIGYRETDFPEGSPYILELPNTSDNVQTHIGEVAKFVDRVKGTRVPRESIAHLDVKVKEAKRLSFLRQLIPACRFS
jgi:hypothetical protein